MEQIKKKRYGKVERQQEANQRDFLGICGTSGLFFLGKTGR